MALILKDSIPSGERPILPVWKGWLQGSAVGTVSVVVLPLSRLVNIASGGFGLSGSTVAQQVEATEGVAGQLLALHVVTDALSQAVVLGLLQKPGVSSNQSGCVAARRVTGPALNVRSAKPDRICEIQLFQIVI